MTDYTCYFDGACEPKNPGGNMGIGAIIFDKDGNEVVKLSHYVKAHPNNSNNVAEYQGFGWIITKLSEIMQDGESAKIHGDSKLVIEQMKGNWQMKKGFYIQFATRAREITQNLSKRCQIELKWIPRAENEVCDSLSKAPMIANNVQ